MHFLAVGDLSLGFDPDFVNASAAACLVGEHPHQGALKFGIRESANRFARDFGISGGQPVSGFQGTVAVQSLEDVGMADAVESTVPKNCLNLFAFHGGTVLQSMYDRQRHLAFG